jgi:hypothetical protein
MAPAQEIDVRIHFWGRFQSLELESSFRNQQRSQEGWQASFALVLGLLFAVAFVPTDRRILGDSVLFWCLFWGRMVQVVASLGLIWAVRKGMTPSAMDRWMLIWAIYGNVLTLVIGWTRPANFFMGYTFSTLFLLLLLYFVAPLPASYQTATALFAIAGNGYLLFRYHGNLDPAILRSIVVSYLATCLIGSTVSRNLHHLKRQQFASLQQLEAALAEVKTLQGILPICSHCKNVRNDAGSWQEVEVYVRENTGAQFSYGICPTCAQAHFGDVLKRKRSSKQGAS